VTPFDRDRKVRWLIAQQKCGQTLNLHDIFEVYRFRTVLGPLGEVSKDTLKARRPDAVTAVLGFTPEDIEPQVLKAVVGQLKAKRLVLLLSNQRVLRDYAKREILLAVNPTLGSA
jgi:hypothetical protein